MPNDASGKYHMNPQIAAKASKVSQPKAPKAPKAPEPSDPFESKPQDDASEKVTSLHDHGDGSFHTEDETGDRVDHDSLDDALAHISAVHGQDAPDDAADAHSDQPVPPKFSQPNYKHLSGI